MIYGVQHFSKPLKRGRGVGKKILLALFFGVVCYLFVWTYGRGFDKEGGLYEKDDGCGSNVVDNESVRGHTGSVQALPRKRTEDRGR